MLYSVYIGLLCKSQKYPKSERRIKPKIKLFFHYRNHKYNSFFSINIYATGLREKSYQIVIKIGRFWKKYYMTLQQYECERLYFYIECERTSRIK